MKELIETAVLGLATGLVASMATWWFLTRVLVPQLVASSQIAIASHDDYRFKIANRGRRDAVDVRWEIALRAEISEVPESRAARLVLRSGEISLVPGGRQPDSEHWFRIRTESASPAIADGWGDHLPADVAADLAAAPFRAIDRLLDAPGFSAVWLELVVAGYDRFSRSPVVIRRRYDRSDFHQGVFVPRSLRVSPTADPTLIPVMSGRRRRFRRM